MTDSEPIEAIVCREALRHITDPKTTKESVHTGLWLSKYLRTRSDSDHQGKSLLIEQALPQMKPSLQAKQAQEHAQAAYQSAYQRWLNAIEALYGQSAWRCDDATTLDRLAVGLGTSSPLEVGLSLNHSYGLPFIPGSALKGLAAAYAHQVLGKDKDDKDDKDWQQQGKHHITLFGSVQKAGLVDFHDAWLCPQSLHDSNNPTLVRDVMTPHHSDYYSQEGGVPPADWDSPIPVPFVTVNRGIKFRIVLGSALPCEDKSEEERLQGWLNLAARLLQKALENWGIGGKTSAGYGRMRMNLSDPKLMSTEMATSQTMGGNGTKKEVSNGR